MRTLTCTKGEPSGTKVWYSLTCSVVLLKFLLAGLTVPGVFEIAAGFDATGAAALIAATGGTYAFRRYSDGKTSA